jgi:DNA-directed RNA polymerase specialized sigma24 family protein
MVQLLRQIAGLAHTVSFDGRREKSSANCWRAGVARNAARNQRRRKQRLSPKSPASNHHRQAARSAALMAADDDARHAMA